MALVMQQKASVGRFEVYFGLDLCRFVKELCAKKRKHSIILYLHSELNRRVAFRAKLYVLVADKIGRMASCCLCVLGNPQRCANLEPDGRTESTTSAGRIRRTSDSSSLSFRRRG